jgi:hypothetical protein
LPKPVDLKSTAAFGDWISGSRREGGGPNMQTMSDDDACQEYLSQLTDRFCTEYGRESALALWALQALTPRGTDADAPSGNVGQQSENQA